MWRFRTGSPWRDMPADHDAWTTAYHRVLQWHDLDRPVIGGGCVPSPRDVAPQLPVGLKVSEVLGSLIRSLRLTG
ncbi:hypothetical protein [Streptomyces aurantiacus]|uniref:Transposase n=1 Tax=Streptomyces aurantiacus TaxID=47760 RepID=A0A7G1PBX1_9ACTN|nr:hypothetical protein GCM10017557_54240 [Streptomyces aurantiacus]